MKVHPFVATFPHLDLIPSPDSFFSSIKSQYSHHRKSGFFVKTEIEAIYIQEIETPFGTHHGIIVNNDLKDLKEGRILKHEKTLNAKEQTMMNFLMKSRAMVKPVLLAYPQVDEITAFIENHIKHHKPIQEISFEKDGVHRYWQISDKTIIKKVQKLFQKNVKRSYIADGHHRCATVLKLAENEHLHEEGVHIGRILSAFYSFDNLKIYDYNRIVDIQGEMSQLKLLSKISKYCKIKPLGTITKPIENHTIHLLIGGECFKLKWKKWVLEKHKDEELLLDATLVNIYFFNKILKIEDVRTDPRISYSEGVKNLSNVVKPLRKEKYKIGIFLPPLEMKEIIQAADHEISLPPKTTWFEPRIKSGLIIKEF